MEKNFSYSSLYNFTYKIFKHIGCSDADATTATKTLLSADVRGIDSHGVARLTGYVRLWQAKRINSNPNIKIIHETISTATVDGDAGLGLVVAPHAMQIAIKKAEQCRHRLGKCLQQQSFWYCRLSCNDGFAKRYDWYCDDECKCIGCANI